MSRRSLPLLGILLASVLAGCGSTSVATSREDGPLKAENDPTVLRGAKLFEERCSGCHTFDVAGTYGGAEKIHDRERVDGPSFNDRPETYGQVMYALSNGGFSGGLMPTNLAVGKDAEALARFLCKYSGSQVEQTASPLKQLTPKQRCAIKDPRTPDEIQEGVKPPSGGGTR